VELAVDPVLAELPALAVLCVLAPSVRPGATAEITAATAAVAAAAAAIIQRRARRMRTKAASRASSRD
jgi:hypothetical protein